MKYIKFQKIALTAALICATTAGFNSTVMAQQALESTKTVAGRIDSSSSLVPVPGSSPMQGVQYIFEAQAGDSIEINATRDEGSSLNFVLIVYPPNGSPIKIEKKDSGGKNSPKQRFLQSSIGVGGTWKVTVASANDSLGGNYQISLLIKRNGTVMQPQKPEQELSYADQVMKKHNLSSTACSTPDVVAVIDIGGEKRCISNWTGGPGEWVYNRDKDEITRKQPADPYIATINSWGATRVDCNAGTAVVRIAFEANKAYCIQPTSAVPAGNYTYDRTTGQIFPLNATPPTPGPVYNTPPDDGPL